MLLYVFFFAAVSCGTEGPVNTDEIGNRLDKLFSGSNEGFVNPRAQLISFGLADLSRLGETLSDHLYSNGLFEEATLALKHDRSIGLTSEEDEESPSVNEYGVQIRGVNICGAQVKALKFRNNNTTAALINVPSFSRELPDFDWIELNSAIEMAELELRNQGVDFEGITIGDSERCFIMHQESLYPVWNLHLIANETLYKSYVGANGVYDLTPVLFHAEGEATVYESNPRDKKLKTFKLSDMSSGGTLENSYFTVSSTGVKVQESDFKFNYNPDSEADKFEQTSLFVHTNLHYDWFKSHGHKWQGSNKLTIVAHAIIKGSVNNALYTPGTSTTPPRIQVGDGDGIRLQNLPRDGDVVSHELGHHIVYEALKETRGESMVIHEGLADFFTFARTGDACLGESICPAGSDVMCEVEAKCLRTGDNDYVLGRNTKHEAHFKSQFISGMLWDLREKEVPGSKLDKLVYNGVLLLLESSGYHDLILGLLLADQDLYNGKYCNAIYQKAVDRGLGDIISDFGCKGNLPNLNAFNNAGGITSSSKSSGSSSDDPFCGIVGANDNGPKGTNWWLLVVLLLPVFLPYARHLGTSINSEYK